jgi:hypothetical protein
MVEDWEEERQTKDVETSMEEERRGRGFVCSKGGLEVMALFSTPGKV